MTSHPRSSETTSDSDAPVLTDPGFRVYRRNVLRVYDWWVHGASNRIFWGVATDRLRQLYEQGTGSTHLELGVGTGKFLAECLPQRSIERLLIADANRNCLEFARQRLSKLIDTPIEVWEMDFRETSRASGRAEDKFQSIGLNYVLHCLPSKEVKRNAIELASRHLAPGGRFFGATLLGEPLSKSRRTRLLERYYQSKGIFQNREDSATRIKQMLNEHFESVEFEEQGRALIFNATS